MQRSLRAVRSPVPPHPGHWVPRHEPPGGTDATAASRGIDPVATPGDDPGEVGPSGSPPPQLPELSVLEPEGLLAAVEAILHRAFPHAGPVEASTNDVTPLVTREREARSALLDGVLGLRRDDLTAAIDAISASALDIPPQPEPPAFPDDERRWSRPASVASG